MEYVFYIKGLIIGILIAAPVGPVGVLCVNRTLSGGRMAGFVSGLGAVTGDGFYAAVAAYGISFITVFMSTNRVWFTLAGGIFLSIIGLRMILAKIDLDKDNAAFGSLAENYASAVMITATNPITIVVFGAVFAALGLGAPGTGFRHSTAIVGGVITGSALCWFCLSGLVDAFRSRFSFSALNVFNRVSGVMLIGFSCFLFMSALGWRQ